MAKPDVHSLALSRTKCILCGGWIKPGSHCLRQFSPKPGLKHKICPQVTLPNVEKDPGPKLWDGQIFTPSGVRPFPYQDVGDNAHILVTV